jgi:hypothetical protein
MLIFTDVSWGLNATNIIAKNLAPNLFVQYYLPIQHDKISATIGVFAHQCAINKNIADIKTSVGQKPMRSAQ